MEELHQALAENEELLLNLRDMWKAGADSGEIASTLTEAGIETTADKVEPLLSKLQQRKAAAISAQELDDEELDRVAGGGDGIDCDGSHDCDLDFKTYASLPRDQRCSAYNYCDEYYAFYQPGR